MSDASQQYYRSKLQLLLQTQNGELSQEKKMEFKLIRADVAKTNHQRLNTLKSDKEPCIHLYEMLCVYVLTHPSIGYHEGMADVASLMLIIQDQEAGAYLSFCAYMNRASQNFSDPYAVEEQCKMILTLLSFFDPSFAQCLMTQEEELMIKMLNRWIKFELQKEFSYPDVVRVLEMQWVTCMTSKSKGISLSEKEATDAMASSLEKIPGQERVQSWLMGDDEASLTVDMTSRRKEGVGVCAESSSSRESSFFNAISTSYSTAGRSDTHSVCSGDSLWTVIEGEQEEKSKLKASSKRPLPPSLNGKAITNPFLIFISTSMLLEYRNELMVKMTDDRFSAATFLQNKERCHNTESVLSRAIYLLKRYLHEHRRLHKPEWSSFLN